MYVAQFMICRKLSVVCTLPLASRAANSGLLLNALCSGPDGSDRIAMPGFLPSHPREPSRDGRPAAGFRAVLPLPCVLTTQKSTALPAVKKHCVAQDSRACREGQPSSPCPHLLRVRSAPRILVPGQCARRVIDSERITGVQRLVVDDQVDAARRDPQREKGCLLPRQPALHRPAPNWAARRAG